MECSSIVNNLQRIAIACLSCFTVPVSPFFFCGSKLRSTALFVYSVRTYSGRSKGFSFFFLAGLLTSLALPMLTSMYMYIHVHVNM